MKLNKTMKKITSVVLSLAMVATSVTVYETTVKADAESRAETITQIQDSTVNLALGKIVRVLPNMQANEGGSNGDGVKLLTDGNVDSNHIATAFNKAGTSYVIDLGDTYNASAIDQIVSQYKEKNTGDTPVKGYTIQYSANGVDYYDIKTVAAQDDAENPSWAEAGQENLDVQLITDEEKAALEGKAVQYVKLLYPDSYAWGIQVKELAVLDINQDAEHVEVPKCDDAAGIEVASNDFNTITYQVIPGENQEEYVYNVYLDGVETIGEGVAANQEYTVSNIEAGTHTLKVVAVYDGKTSVGITSEEVVVEAIASLVTGTKNIASTLNNEDAKIISVSSFYDESHTLDTAQVAIDGLIPSGEGSTVAIRTGANQQPAEIVIDLGNDYKPAQFKSVLIGYSNPRTYAATAKVAFSSDNEIYTEVAENTGYSCNKDNTGTADINAFNLDKIEDYTERSVRYVKISLSDGTNGWGYVINEIGIALTVDVSEATVVTSKNPIDAPTVASKEYTGDVLTADVQDTDDYTVTKNEGGTDAGSYEVVLTLKDPDNFYWSDDNKAKNVTKTLTFEITKAANEWTTSLAIDSWKYGEEAKTPFAAAKFGKVVYTYSASEDGEYTDVVPENAGNYYVKAEISGTDNYAGLEATAQFSIEKAGQSAPEGIDTVKSTLKENADGKITNVTDAMEYRAEGEAEYKAIEGTEIADLLAGTYYVRYKETENYSASADTEVVVETGRKLTVNLNQGTGYVLEAVDTETNEVEYGTAYAFKLTIRQGYKKGSAFAVKVNGQTVESDSEGIYTIESVTEDTEVVVEDVIEDVPDTTAPVVTDPTTDSNGGNVTPTKPQTTTKKALGKTTVKTATKKKAAKKVNITFKKVTGAKKYTVQISATKKFKKILVKKTVKKVKVTITNKKFKNNKKLYVRVRAVGAKQWSKAKRIKIKK